MRRAAGTRPTRGPLDSRETGGRRPSGRAVGVASPGHGRSQCPCAWDAKSTPAPRSSWHFWQHQSSHPHFISTGARAPDQG